MNTTDKGHVCAFTGMVDHASRLNAVYTIAPGSTKDMICYAKTQGLKVIGIADGTEEQT